MFIRKQTNKQAKRKNYYPKSNSSNVGIRTKTMINLIEPLLRSSTELTGQLKNIVYVIDVQTPPFSRSNSGRSSSYATAPLSILNF